MQGEVEVREEDVEGEEGALGEGAKGVEEVRMRRRRTRCVLGPCEDTFWM